jgi:hypothetical protein
VSGAVPPGKETCPRCRGCGQIANDDDGTPWSFWLQLPLGSSLAVLAGIVKPIACPACDGSGDAPPRVRLDPATLRAVAADYAIRGSDEDIDRYERTWCDEVAADLNRRADEAEAR